MQGIIDMDTNSYQRVSHPLKSCNSSCKVFTHRNERLCLLLTCNSGALSLCELSTKISVFFAISKNACFSKKRIDKIVEDERTGDIS